MINSLAGAFILSLIGLKSTDEVVARECAKRPYRLKYDRNELKIKIELHDDVFYFTVDQVSHEPTGEFMKH